MTMTDSTSRSTPDTSTEKPTQDFLAFLAGVAKGRAVVELGEKLTELAQAVDNTGRGGTLTLKLAIKPAGKTDGAVVVTDEITLKAPKLTRPESFFFTDSDGALLRTNPNQNELF